ncbi:MAG: carboxymuconolactone decarboxylase family protein [Clostridiales bacterium]|nr:carboxymuconolactone decarboxylase family protein [Clostridiales bacterium]
MKQVTKDMQVLLQESDGVGPAFMNAIMKMSEVSSLDSKTHELCYLSVLAALQSLNGIAYHVERAKEEGASLLEVKSAILVGMPLVGIRLSESFAKAISSYNET